MERKQPRSKRGCLPPLSPNESCVWNGKIECGVCCGSGTVVEYARLDVLVMQIAGGRSEDATARVTLLQAKLLM